ncbi:hypothetical protein [Pseudomonas huanghezhanensis]|uniref:hypothetical protein n=1 Tax=Pseudomonas huanghezhanensis TaxID=3002903 RepID=UPI00228552EB|nr:hypothetical protein [Pseudomonas sp. BSw22131]
MSRLKEFHDLEHALKIHMARLEALKTETELTTELEFEKKLTALMKRFNKGTEDVIEMLRWQPSVVSTSVHEDKPTYAVDVALPKKKPAAKR